MPALDDLRRCLERTHQHDELVREFRSALLSRLLQPGANTSEILDIYVSTIKVGMWTRLQLFNYPIRTSTNGSWLVLQAFRILDPKGVLLEALSEPVKEVDLLSAASDGELLRLEQPAVI